MKEEKIQCIHTIEHYSSIVKYRHLRQHGLNWRTSHQVNKPYTEKQMLHILTHMWNWKKKKELTLQKQRVEQLLPGIEEGREKKRKGRGWSMNTKQQLDRRDNFWCSIARQGDMANSKIWYITKQLAALNVLTANI